VDVLHHELSLISTVAVGLGLALLLGFVALKLRMPALVGYLMAGILIGPATPGFVADVGLASQLAEIGVMLLMFGVGLHFSFADLLAVRRLALPGALVQMGVATGLGLLLGQAWGWGWGGALVFGLALSVASTVVLLKALESRAALDSGNGRIAVGWLVVEDLAMVLVLVLLPALAPALGGVQAEAGAPSLAWTLGKTLLLVSAFVVLMWVAGRRLLPWLLWQVARTGSRELFTLCVVVAAVTLAYAASAVFGVSFALGAFFAGMVLRESAFSHRAAEESLPLRDAFAVLFFVSVGMLFDPHVLLEQPGRVLAVVAVIVLGKSVAAAGLVLLLRYPLNTALTVSAGLAQVGEFSFILAALGVSLGLLPLEGQSLVLAGALISMALNPLLFALIEPLRAWVLPRSALARRLEQRDDPLAELPSDTEARFLARQVVVVGHGRVGQALVKALRQAGRPVVVAERERVQVEALRAAGIPAVLGDAAQPEVLIQAHIARADSLVVTAPDGLAIQAMLRVARSLNPSIQVLALAANDDEAQRLRLEGVDVVYSGAQAQAQALRAALQAGQREPAPAPGSAAASPHH